MASGHPNQRFIAAITVGFCLAGPSFASAQAYPSKPVRIVSTFGSGSAAVTAIRTLGVKMGEALGQPIVIDVQTGAGGMVGGQTVAKSAPDGYTLLFTELVTNSMVAYVHKAPLFDPLRDFTPISDLFESSICLVANIKAPFDSVKEMIQYAKANPGKLAYGSNGVGAQNHLQMEMLKQQMGLDITHVPYKGGTGAIPDLMSGVIPMIFVAVGTALPLHRAGKVKILAIVDRKRRPDIPDLPAMGEDVPGFEKIPAALVLFGPAKLPRTVTGRLHAEIVRAMNLPDVRKRLTQIAYFGIAGTPEQLIEQRRRAIDITVKAMQAAGVKPE
jgi:tripartite-type tricarboxylate transporter receptor subunit TctC